MSSRINTEFDVTADSQPDRPVAHCARVGGGKWHLYAFDGTKEDFDDETSAEAACRSIADAIDNAAVTVFDKVASARQLSEKDGQITDLAASFEDQLAQSAALQAKVNTLQKQIDTLVSVAVAEAKKAADAGADAELK